MTGAPLTGVWCELAWLGGDTPTASVLINFQDGVIASVATGVPVPAAISDTTRRLEGLTLPGLANAHSHCFQRALRGRTQAPVSRGSFWTWREQMYALAERMDEERYEALARATFAEMALAGYTVVGEFDYLHHSAATARAAQAAGLRLTLIDACYLRGGIPAFRDASAEAWCSRMSALERSGALDDDRVRAAAAIHSVRAVDLDSAATVAAFAEDRGWPLHAHVSEQPRENAECRERYGMTPTALLAAAGALSPRFSAIHMTHIDDRDLELMSEAGAYCCMCPTTERDLADGIGPVAGRLTLGSDSQSVIDPFEEARAVELDNRLATGTRGSFGAAALMTGLTVDGYASLGWPSGGMITAGALADLTTVSLAGVRLAGIAPPHALDAVLFAATAADVTDVIVAGAPVIRAGAHVSIDVGAELAGAVSGAWGEPVTASLAIDNIGLLLSSDPEVGVRRRAALLIADGVVAEITEAGSDAVSGAENRLDAAGRCVLPGFVDSHTHLVFAGDRSEEFARRMAGQPYAAGGIQLTVDATRAAGDDALRRAALDRRAEAIAAGITHTEIKSGYALDVEGEARLCRLAAELTDDVTYLGAHLVPAEYRNDPDAYVALACGPMLAACAPHARWIDVFCETRAFTAEQSREVLGAGAAAGLGLRVHGNQLGPGPGVGLAVELGAASVDHCTFLTDADVEALAGSDTVATLLPATEFATRQPYPNARALLDAGVSVAIATNCNPGSSYTTSMSFCIALAVREMGMTIEEAVSAATAGGAAALRRTDIGRLAPGCRGDAVILDAPSPAHLAYRPGVPLIAATVLAGEVAGSARH